jgi:hypothetical protein
VSKMPAQTPRTLPEPRYWEILENDIRGRYKVPKETCNTCEHGLECQVLNCQRIRDDLPISAFTFVSENPACYRPLGLLSRPNFADAIKFNYLWKSPAVPLGLKLKILAELSEKCLKIMTEKSLRAEKELANTPEVPAMAHRDYYNPEMLDAYKNANAITQHAFQAWGYRGLAVAEVAKESVDFARSDQGQIILNRSLSFETAHAGTLRTAYRQAGQPDMCIGAAFNSAHLCCDIFVRRLYVLFTRAVFKAANMGSECLNRNMRVTFENARVDPDGRSAIMTLNLGASGYTEGLILGKMANELREGI